MIKPLLNIAVLALFACSRSGTRPLYTEEDVRAFVQPGTSCEAIIKRFGEPLVDDKHPKFEGGYTEVDEIMFYAQPPEPRRLRSTDKRTFAGFQVRLKDGKAVEWMGSYWD